LNDNWNHIDWSYSVAYEIAEELDRFILSTIQNGLYKDTKIIIPKKLILEALKTFKEEHSDRYEILSNIEDD